MTLMLMCTIVANAADFQLDGICYNILSGEDRTVEVTFIGDNYSTFFGEYTGVVTIPDSVVYNGATYHVIAIGEGAFGSCSGLSAVEIPASVTSIGKNAFYGVPGYSR